MTERLWFFGTHKLRAADGTPLVEMVKAHSRGDAIKSLLIRHPLYQDNAGRAQVMNRRDWDYIESCDIASPQLDS